MKLISDLISGLIAVVSRCAPGFLGRCCPVSPPSDVNPNLYTVSKFPICLVIKCIHVRFRMIVARSFSNQDIQCHGMCVAISYRSKQTRSTLIKPKDRRLSLSGDASDQMHDALSLPFSHDNDK